MVPSPAKMQRTERMACVFATPLVGAWARAVLGLREDRWGRTMDAIIPDA